MHLKDYKSGRRKRQYEYESFSPTLVNQQWTWDNPRINTLLEEATRALGELNAYSLIVPDVDLFIQMHVLKEASTSSRIEGMQTGLEDAVRPIEHIDPDKRDDWQEVQNYVHAMNQAIEALGKLPLSNRLLKEAHAILLSGARGKHKTPGEFRRSQNWIGGASLKDAAFIPPHQDEVDDLMSDLEAFWHNDSILVPHLIRIAISHYQFETIHPFQDGNGRLGRLLITLYLVSKGCLSKPTLYLSSHLEKHKGAYFDSLTQVRGSDDMDQWVRFFLVAVAETARKGVDILQRVLAVKNRADKAAMHLGRRAALAQNLFGLLYRQPVVSIGDVISNLGVTHQAASRLVKDLTNDGLLKETTGYQRNREFVLWDYFTSFAD